MKENLEKKQEKEDRKKKIQKLNEPPKLTNLEEVGNAVTHGIGALLAIAGMVLLLVKSDTGLKVMASCFYGISLFFLMLLFLYLFVNRRNFCSFMSCLLGEYFRYCTFLY